MASIVIAGDTSGSVTLQAPSAAGSGTVITLPTTSSTLVTPNSTDTLTNKTLTSPIITSPSFSGAVVLSGTNTLSGNTTLSGASNSITNAAITASTLTVSGGTTSAASLIMTSGSALSSNGSAGAFEFDGSALYASPATSSRGVIPTMSTFCLTSDYAGSNATGDQAAFGQSSFTFWNPAATGITYMFEVNIALTKTAGTTSHTISFGFGNGATVTNIFYRGTVNWGSSSTITGLLATPQQFAATTGALTVASGAIATAAANWSITVVGAVRFSGTGTWGPRYSLSAAPGGAYNTLAGSFMRVWPIGNIGNTGGGNVSVRLGNWS